MKPKAAGVLAIILGIVLFFSIGYSASLQEETGHQIILTIIAFIPLISIATWINLKSSASSLIRVPILIGLSAVPVLWLEWAGVSLSPMILAVVLFIVIFLLTCIISFFGQRSIILRFNAAYEAKSAGGNSEDLLKEIESCEEALKNCNGLDITYGGTPFRYMILLHKAALLRDMGRKQESIALYKEVYPKIKDPETQKAIQKEIDSLKEMWP